VYEVVVAAAVASVEHVSLSTTAMTAGPTVSRLTLVILIFAAIVPSTPSRTLVVALIAASMDPLAMAMAIAARHLDVSPAHLLWMHIPDYMSAGVGTLISQVITRLGHEVRDARELGATGSARCWPWCDGEVYVAHHRMLARPAAIKLIRSEKAAFDGTEHAQRVALRFRREAEAAAGLRSPHTIELYDLEDRRRHALLRDGAAGRDRSRVSGGAVRPHTTRPHGARPAAVCASLAEAHAQGLVHRDIKPANIHLCRMASSTTS